MVVLKDHDPLGYSQACDSFIGSRSNASLSRVREASWFAEGETDKLLDLPYDMAPGLYTLNATVTDQRFSQRLVVE